MPDVDEIISRIESLIENEEFSSPAVQKRPGNEYRVSVCAIVCQVKHLIREEQYPLHLAMNELAGIAGAT